MNWNSPIYPDFLTTHGCRLPVNRIFCSARNYKEHVEEMGGEVDRERPFHFQKSIDTLTSGLEVRYPSNTNDLHHEAKMVAIEGESGRNLVLKKAEAAIFGYAVGLDFTRRDRQ